MDPAYGHGTVPERERVHVGVHEYVPVDVNAHVDALALVDATVSVAARRAV